MHYLCTLSNIYLQWILQKKNVTAFIGSVGKDDYSRILENKAREDGVNVRYQYTAERQTGKIKYFGNFDN